jgi:GNAT superfamily N-acetyltransferase
VGETLQIVHATTPAHIEQVKALLMEFMDWSLQTARTLGLNADALAEAFYQHALELPGAYVPPDGCLLLAQYGTQAAGCGALRRLDASRGEIGRMYVRPDFRGKKIGRVLLERLIQKARQIGYSGLRLETATYMTDAHALYRALGFEEVEPYVELPDDLMTLAIFMGLNLMEHGCG